MKADEENGNFLIFSNDDEQAVAEDEMNNFIDDTLIEEEDVSFYRGEIPLDINDYPKFNGQVRNPLDAIYVDGKPNCGCEDEHPELYVPEKRIEVTFDKFEGFEKSIEKFENICKF